MGKGKGYNVGMMPGNMNNLMKQAQRMQKHMEETTKELEDKIYESSVGGGVVTAKVSGKKELMEIKLDPEVVDPEDIDTLEDLIISAVNEAFRMQDKDYNENMSKISGGMNLGGLPF
ncbi:MAG: YbaB/EbfC family nucleoid-associated protein [Coprococcus sp.]